jgi:acyl-CoA synthetase (AMP-forming)/AMP-acid ligase II
VTIRIVDEVTGALVAASQPGLIEVTGHVMRGYIGASADQTAAALTADGFFRTGDMGELTPAEMIKKGGINIAPAEVEDVLMRHPSVAQAGVVGLADRTRGELIAAFVLLKPGRTLTAAELTAHCRDLASRYKIPDFISFRDSLPVTATGKLMRRELKTLAADMAR